jgi:TonB family protein
MKSVTPELGAIAVRTRRMMYGSTVVHALLLVWFLVHQTVVAQSEGLTEITWVEVAPPSQPEPAAPPVAARETKTAPTQEVVQRPSRREPAQQFKRELTRATVEPVPQKTTATEDVISSRLSSLTNDARATDTRVAQMVPPPNVGAPSLAGVERERATRSAPSELERDKTTRTAPIELARAATAPTQTAAVVVPDVMPAVASPRAEILERSNSRRQVAGAQLAGPVADRGLISYAKPSYPDWAKREGVEGSVTLYFLVLPDGSVKENILVDKTSGFGDFDESAVSALRTWRFAAVNATGEQWGSITFHFRLTDG